MNTRDPAEARDRRFRARDGLSLSATEWGIADRPCALLLHGGGQTRHSWGPTGSRLAANGFHAVALDARGHGDSDWATHGDYTWTRLADDIACVVDQLGTTTSLVGASAGGLAALLATGTAVVEPEALVLVDVVVHLEAEGVERIRAFMRANPDGFDSLHDAAESVASYLPGRERPDDVSGLAKNLRRGGDGRWRWHWDPRWLALGDRRIEEYDRLVDAARAVTVPTLLVRGKQSDVVSMAGVDEFRKLVPHAEFVDVHGAGHMVAGDRNDAFGDAIVEFLRRVTLSPGAVHGPLHDPRPLTSRGPNT